MVRKGFTFIRNHLSTYFFLLFFFILFVVALNSLLLFKIEYTQTSLLFFIIPYAILTGISMYLLISLFRTRDIIKQNIESEERYKKLIDHHPDGIVIHEQGRVVYANSSALMYLGYNTSDVLGREILDFVHPSGHDKILKRGIEIYSTKKDVMFDLSEYELICSDGSSFFVESKAIVCQFNNKRCVQLVLRDINDRKKQEELLKVSDKLAVVGQLAAGIAHEIRNPLTSIKGFMQMMKEATDSPFYYDIILGEINRIHQVTNDFLILAKPQAKDFSIFDLNQILKDTITLMQPEALLHNVSCSFHQGKQILSLECNQNEIKQVYINIIKNSIEAMPNGGTLTIRSSLERNKIVTIIEDTGIGIPQDRLINIGQPFYTLKEKGTGLGLMTTIKIIERHKGTFDINSTEGKGTIVTIEFPYKEQDW